MIKVKKVKDKKVKDDWFDTHVEVMTFGKGSHAKNKKIKSMIKERLIKDLTKENVNVAN